MVDFSRLSMESIRVHWNHSLRARALGFRLAVENRGTEQRPIIRFVVKHRPGPGHDSARTRTASTIDELETVLKSLEREARRRQKLEPHARQTVAG